MSLFVHKILLSPSLTIKYRQNLFSFPGTAFVHRISKSEVPGKLSEGWGLDEAASRSTLSTTLKLWLQHDYLYSLGVLNWLRP